MSGSDMRTKFTDHVAQISQDITNLDTIRAYLVELRDRYNSDNGAPPAIDDRPDAVIRRIIGGYGHKAITLAFEPREDENRILIGVSDSGTAAQYSKKEGVRIAKSRLGMIVINASVRPLSANRFVRLLCNGLECESTYESLSAALRPLINALNAKERA